MTTQHAKYVMTISRQTIDKLGVKLYDKISAVIAELVANSYDADATEVKVRAPMGELLTSKRGNGYQDKGFSIEVIDNGIGMVPEEVNSFFLRVGAERRNDPKRGEISKVFRRKVMGRKGVGKLAPFGICTVMEVITSGGDLVDGFDENGTPTKGYTTAHFKLNSADILQNSEVDYEPTIGELDSVVRPNTGTILRLSCFYNRHVPDINDLARQLAQRFGIQSVNWKIVLEDIQKETKNPNFSRFIGSFDIPVMEGTLLRFDFEKNLDGTPRIPETWRVFTHDNNIRTDLTAGFTYEDRFYPINGWVAYAKDNYKDDLMAGVRIYCRGKIAAQTGIFNRKSGFTGEYDIRSYLVGEINADWLDEAEDLIQTDRRDILWSHDLGKKLEEWGQSIVETVGKSARNPIKKKVWEQFQETSDISQRVEDAFPGNDQQSTRENALEIAKSIGKSLRLEEAKDTEQVNAIVDLSLALAPHVTLDRKLREAADEKTSPLTAITQILKTARIAELSSFGHIADERIKIINRLEKLKDDPNTLEDAFQELIEQAPWLIDPQWSPISANAAFTTLRDEFQKYYKTRTGQDISLGDFSKGNKRADFVLSSQDNTVQIIEIKKPNHKFENQEMDRLNTYFELMRDFLADESHGDFRKVFNGFRITLVCNGEKLTGVHQQAFQGLQSRGVLIYIDWTSFLLRTRKMHEEFLKEAERQKRYVMGVK